MFSRLAAAGPNPVPDGMMTPRRLLAVCALLVGLVGALIAGSGLIGPAPKGRRAASVGLLAGLLGATSGGLVVLTAKGGLGTGQGLGGGVIAVVVGLLSVGLGALARTRSLRAGQISSTLRGQ